MIYELENGQLFAHQVASTERCLIPNKERLYIRKINSAESLVINTFKNKCLILPTRDLDEGVGSDVLHLFDVETETQYIPVHHRNYADCTTFIFAITYQCNMRCSYCYQQNSSELKKKKISSENLEKALSVIEEYMVHYPQKTIEFGLFGGEPLLPQNEQTIDRIFEFCRKHGIRVHIISNGTYLEYFLKKLVINRRIISHVAVTIDSVKLNHVTRKCITGTPESKTENLIRCLKTLMYYGINAMVSTNIDRHNLFNILEMKRDFEDLGLLNDEHFWWSIGRVDDRLFETNYPDIVMESQIIEQLLQMPLQSNIQAAFIKTSFNLLKKMGKDLNQAELRGLHNYCWVSSIEDSAFYIDNELKTYRCTYTVGRPSYSLFDFSLDALESYSPENRTAALYPKCQHCPLGGYCGGGCKLSHGVDIERTCKYEKKSFDYFIEKILLPYVNNLREQNDKTD